MEIDASTIWYPENPAIDSGRGFLLKLATYQLRYFSPEGDTGDAGAVRHRMNEESKALARRATQIFNGMIVSPPRATSIKRFNLTGA